MTNDSTPFVAIGNNELGDAVPDDAGILCMRCGGAHKIEYGKNEAGEETRILGFVRCGEKAYVVTVDGWLVFGSAIEDTERETS